MLSKSGPSRSILLKIKTEVERRRTFRKEYLTLRSWKVTQMKVSSSLKRKSRSISRTKKIRKVQPTSRKTSARTCPSKWNNSGLTASMRSVMLFAASSPLLRSGYSLDTICVKNFQLTAISRKMPTTKTFPAFHLFKDPKKDNKIFRVFSTKRLKMMSSRL